MIGLDPNVWVLDSSFDLSRQQVSQGGACQKFCVRGIP